MNYEEKLTDIIASLPEIEGGFLFAPERGVYGNQATEISSTDDLLQLALKFSKILSMLSVHFQDTGNFRVTFKDLVLFARVLDQGQWLFLFHRPSLSPGMIDMTVKLAINIQSDETAPKENQEGASLQPPPASISVATDKNILKELLDSKSELREPLAGINDELSKYIGPVAGLIFEEVAEEWAANFSPTFENLSELTRTLKKEIDNDSDRESFQKAVEAILPGGQH